MVSYFRTNFLFQLPPLAWSVAMEGKVFVLLSRKVNKLVNEFSATLMVALLVVPPLQVLIIGRDEVLISCSNNTEELLRSNLNVHSRVRTIAAWWRINSLLSLPEANAAEALVDSYSHLGTEGQFQSIFDSMTQITSQAVSFIIP